MPACLALLSGSTWIVICASSDFGLERALQAVADVVRLGDAHVARHDEVEIDEGHPAGMAGAQIVRLDGAFRIDRR